MADHNIRQRPVVGGAVESSGKAVRLSDENPIWEPKVQAKSAGLVNARCLKISAAVAVTVVVGFCLWIRSLDAQGMMLAIMKCEQELFKELNITFYIDEGTLLGAVRDGGFFDADDREDTDWSILAKDTDYLYNLRHLSRERCGFPMIHRSDRAWMPNWLPLVCRRSAFRVFYGYMYPYFYLDIRDYDVVDGKLIDLDNVADFDTGNFPVEKIFPLRKCKFEDAEFPCPKDAEWVLEEEYGADWRVRKRGFKTWMLEKSYVDEVKEKTT